MLYSLLHTSSEINRLLLHDSCAKELAYVISALYQKNYRNFEVHVLTSGMKPNATSKFSDHCLFCAKYYLFLIATERSFVSRNQKPGHVAMGRHLFTADYTCFRTTFMTKSNAFV